MNSEEEIRVESGSYKISKLSTEMQSQLHIKFPVSFKIDPHMISYDFSAKADLAPKRVQGSIYYTS